MKPLTPAVWLAVGFIAALAIVIAVGTLTAPLTPEEAASRAASGAYPTALVRGLLAGGPLNFSQAFRSPQPFVCTSTFARQDATFTVTTYVQNASAAMVTSAQSPTLGNATVQYVFTDRAYVKVTPDVQKQSPAPDCAWLRLPPTREPLPGVVEALAGGANATCVPALERAGAFSITGKVCEYNPATDATAA